MTWMLAIALLAFTPARPLVHGDGLEEFGRVAAAKTFTPDDLAARRAYINAYVEFIHLVERVYDSLMQSSRGHVDERETPSNSH